MYIIIHLDELQVTAKPYNNLLKLSQEWHNISNAYKGSQEKRNCRDFNRWMSNKHTQDK